MLIQPFNQRRLKCIYYSSCTDYVCILFVISEPVSLALIIGSAVGGAVFLVALIVTIYVCYRYMAKKKKERQIETEKQNAPSWD